MHVLMLAAMLATQPAERPPEPDADRLHQVLGFALIGTAAADVLITEYGVSSGLEEANPLLGGSTGTRVGGSIAYTAAAWYFTEKLHVKHPKWAKAIRIASVGLYGYAIAHNLRRID